MRGLTPEQRARLAEILSVYEDYASRYLRIIPKIGGALVPLQFNAAQKFLDRKINEQRQSTGGKVRAIVLKGRQQGISTYTEGRLLWRIGTTHGIKGYVLAHEQAASDNLFKMLSRYYENLPGPVQPALGASNAKELVFSRLESRVEVATAGSKDTGRSGTAQFMHASEVAFWPNADTHMAGIGQTVADAPGTEIILESTANGTANVFHEFWQMAVAGRSDYMPVFIPWFWQLEYTRDVPAGFELTDEEREYQEAFGCTMGQMVWRRNKIDTDFKGDVSLFDQEYPASAELAFASSSPRALISAALVMAARKVRGVEPIGPKILGVDPAEYGDDETSCMLRQGRVAIKLGGWQGLGPMETVAKVTVLADRYKVDAIHVDATNSAGITDRLRELGYPAVRVHFGEAARQDDLYVNCRDEMWGEMLDWLRDKPASIPDNNSLAAQLTGVQKSYDSKRRIKLEPKEAMKKRGLRSPDDADALALTFYQGGVGTNDASAFRNRQRFS